MTKKNRRIGRVRDRVGRLEAETGLDKGQTVTVLTDDCGHTEYPMGKPRPGDKMLEVHLGGVDIEKDF